MFEKLFDKIAELWNEIMPFYIVLEYQEAVVMRFGHYKDVKKAGFYWKLPFVDDVTKQHVIVTTLSCGPQHLETADNQVITAESIVKYNVEDVKKYILELFDAVDGIKDITQSTIKRMLSERTYDECRTNDMDDTITKKVRSEVRKYGINVHQVTLTSLSRTRNYRLIGDMRTD